MLLSRLPYSLPILLSLSLLPICSSASSPNPVFQPAAILTPAPPSPPPSPPPSSLERFTAEANRIVYAATGIDALSFITKVSEGANYHSDEDEQDGVVRLTDENWERLVELEDLPEGVKEEERVWCVLVHGPKSDALTTTFFQAHALAANTTKLLAANSSDPLDMQHVTFARVSYLDVSEITTRWLIFKPPYFVFVSSRGRELRFLSPRSVRPDGDLLRGVLAKGGWKDAPVWQGRFAPGGSWETPLRYAGKGLAVFMDKTKNVPRFVWLMLSGLISQQMLSYMHGSSPSTKKSTSSTQQQKVIHPAGSNEARAVADALRKRAAAAPKSDVRSEERAH